MSIVWPVSLPQDVQIGFEENTIVDVTRTQVAVGSPKVRRRSTRVRYEFSGLRLTLTADQVADLETFFVTDTECGALEFEWVHPRTGATLTNLRFKDAPRKRNLSPGTADGIYEVTFSLETT